MIKYTSHHFIDRKKYDQCIKLDNSRLPYAFSWYLDTICESWDALVLDDYQAVWPLPVRQRWGMRSFFRPYGARQLGIFSHKSLPGGALEDFLSTMLSHCHRAQLCLNHGQLPRAFFHSKVSFTENRSPVLDLDQPYRSIYEKYHNNLLQDLREAEDHKLQLFENDGPDVILELYRQTKGREERHSELFYRNLKKLMYRALHKGQGKLYTVYGGPNMLLAAAFFIVYQRRHTLLCSATAPLGAEEKAMPFLLNEYILFQSEKAEYLDLSEMNASQLPQLLGAHEEIYPCLRYRRLPSLLNWLVP